MLYKAFILIFSVSMCSVFGMETDDTDKRPEHFKTLIEAHLPEFKPVIGKDNSVYFAAMYEDKHAELKDIQHSGYDYKLYNKSFATIESNSAIDIKDTIDQNPFIAALFANDYAIYLTPKEDLNSDFFWFLISLMKDNKLVFKDSQRGDVRVNDIIFNVKMSLDTDLGSTSNRPRFTIMINNFFDSKIDKGMQFLKAKTQEIILKKNHYQRTKIYTEQLLIFLIKQIREQIPKREITGSNLNRLFAYPITDWLWVKQATGINKYRKLYIDETKSFAFLRPDIAGKLEDYAIDRAKIIDQANALIDSENTDLSVKKLSEPQEFLAWPDFVENVIKDMLPKCILYKKNNIIFFNKPKTLKIMTLETILYSKQENIPFDGLFAFTAAKDRALNESDILSEEKNYIYSAFTNCYQVYLMPEQANKESILRLLAECVQNNQLVYQEKNHNIRFNDIVFNISVNLDTIKNPSNPTFILYVSNIVDGGSTQNTKDMAQEQNVYRTKKHTEQLILFLHEKFKQAECLAFSDQIPQASVQIKDLFFVSQGLHNYFLARKDTIFDATKNFAYFLPGVTGKEEDYIINPEKLFGKEEPKLPNPDVQKSINQSIPVEHKRQQENDNVQPINNQSKARSSSSMWTLIGQWLIDAIIAPFVWINNVLNRL